MSQRTTHERGKLKSLAVWLCLIMSCVEAGKVAAQTPALEPSSPVPAIRLSEKHFLRDFVRDEKALWTSPLRVRPRDLKWMLPLAAATAVLLTTDRRASGEMRELVLAHPATLTASRRVSQLGSPEATFGLAGGMYLIGRFTHDDRLRETGLLSAAALLHTSLVTTALKAATNRQRPDKGYGRGEFWAGGKSFPSGHASTSFALATVIAHEYHDKPLIRWGAYGVAATVSASRVTGLKHHPSDVVIGGTLGFLIGRYVVRQHAAPEAGGVKTTLSPYVQPATHSAGLSVQWNF